MSSEGRYVYSQSGSNSTFEYPSYPPPHSSSGYDGPHMGPPRSTRPPSSSQSHSPHTHHPVHQPPHQASHATSSQPAPPVSHQSVHQAPNPGPYQPLPPPSYTSSGSGHYLPQPAGSVVPAHLPAHQPPQWSHDNWQYNQQYAAPPPPPQHAPAVEPPFNSGSKSEVAVEQTRGQATAPNSAASDPRQVEDRLTLQSGSSQVKPRRHEKESSPPTLSPSIPSGTGLDFIKLLDSYRIIIDGSEALAKGDAHGRPLAMAETLERMLQSAIYGSQMLEAATVQNPAPSIASRSPTVKETEEPKEMAGQAPSPPKRQKPDDPAQEGQTCLGCNATSTPEWRRGPMGPRTLCNACGLVYAKLIKKRVREKFGAVKNANGLGASDSQGIGDDSIGDESDEEDRESQEHRSEA